MPCLLYFLVFFSHFGGRQTALKEKPTHQGKLCSLCQAAPKLQPVWIKLHCPCCLSCDVSVAHTGTLWGCCALTPVLFLLLLISHISALRVSGLLQCPQPQKMWICTLFLPLDGTLRSNLWLLINTCDCVSLPLSSFLIWRCDVFNQLTTLVVRRMFRWSLDL